MVHIFNTSTWEAEAGRCLSVQGQPGLHSEIPGLPGLCRAPVCKNKNKQKIYENKTEGGE